MKDGILNSLKEIVGSGLAGIASVFRKGPAEEAGEKIDTAVRKTKRALRDMADGAKKP